MASPINVLDKLLAEERKKERKKNNNKNINKKRSKHNMSPKLRLGDIIILEFHTDQLIFRNAKHIYFNEKFPFL
jgi:hypothetical protein